MKTFQGGVPELLYLDLKPVGGLAGRGGAVRFFLLRNSIEFNEKLVSMEEWRKDVKTNVLESKNPTGRVPVVSVAGKNLTEHHAILRYFSRQLKEYGKDELRDYHVDRTASASNDWRDELIAGLFNPEAKEKYLAERAGFYKLFNHFIEIDSGHGAHMVGSHASYADDLIFAILWDDSQAYGKDLIAEYLKLQEFFDEYRKQPAIDAWCTAQAS